MLEHMRALVRRFGCSFLPAVYLRAKKRSRKSPEMKYKHSTPQAPLFAGSADVSLTADFTYQQLCNTITSSCGQNILRGRKRPLQVWLATAFNRRKAICLDTRGH